MSYKPTIAIIGYRGYLGEPTLAAFGRRDVVGKIQLPIKVLTESETEEDTDTVQFVKTGLGILSKDHFTEVLQGTDVIIELFGDDVQLLSLMDGVLKEVRPKVLIPSQFGTDIPAAQKLLPGFLATKSDHSAHARNLGIKVVDIYTSLFAIPGAFLYDIVAHVGIDVDANTVTFIGDPNTKIAVTSPVDIGQTIATLSVIEPSKLPDEIRIQSDEVSYDEIRQRYESNHNVKLAINCVRDDEALSQLQKRFSKQKKVSAEEFFYSLHVLGAQGVDKGLSFSKVDNQIVNPNGLLWTWSSY